MPLPGLHETVWDEREYLGWLDPTFAQRGYIVYWREGKPFGIVLRSASSSMSRGISAMCSLCRTHQPGSQVSLFTVPKAGQAGLNGNTIGTYICSDLSCSTIIRIVPPPSDLQPRPTRCRLQPHLGPARPARQLHARAAAGQLAPSCPSSTQRREPRSIEGNSREGSA